MPKKGHETTSRKAGSAASRMARNPASSRDDKTAAGSALTQRPNSLPSRDLKTGSYTSRASTKTLKRASVTFADALKRLADK